MNDIEAKYGGLDAAVHCAYPRSSGWGAKFGELTEANLSEDLCLQMGGTILFAQTVLSYFLRKQQGNLILVSSIQGVAAPKFDHYSGTDMVSPAEYTAMKAGTVSLVKYLAKYYRNCGIRVNCVSPGGIKADQPSSFVTRYRDSCNFKGLLDAEDLGPTFAFLLSDLSRYINGQNIIVDDGWSL